MCASRPLVPRVLFGCRGRVTNTSRHASSPLHTTSMVTRNHLLTAPRMTASWSPTCRPTEAAPRGRTVPVAGPAVRIAVLDEDSAQPLSV